MNDVLDLRLCSRINLHNKEKENLSEHIRDGLSFLEKSGFDAADFTMKLIEPLGSEWQKCIEVAKADATSLGIKFEICHLPFSLKICKDPSLLPKFVFDMHNAIDAAATLGVSYSVLHPGTITLPLSDYDRVAQYDAVMAHLAPFAEHADRVGVRLCLENMPVVHENYPTHRYCQDPDELCDVADALGIDVCWDFGHANIAGLKQSDALGFIGKRLKAVHVNDNCGIGDDHIPPFMGTIDWRDAALGLANIGYTGLFNYEIATDKIPSAAKESFANYLREAAKEIMRF